MVRRNIIITLLAFLASTAATIPVQSQLTPADTTLIDTLPADTAGGVITDSTDDSLTLEDSLFIPDSLLSDTLSEAAKARIRFEYRRKKLQERKALEERREPLLPRFSFKDSLATAFLPPRMNLSSLVDRSFFQDAGGYFRLHPSFFTTDYHETPGRKTVRPFTLPGDRLGVVLDGNRLHPFDHIAEPDGLLDMNDIPTAASEDIFIVPGPLGAILGGGSGVASLYTRPRLIPEDDYEARSSFLLDKGQLGYSYTRARYNKQFSGGRTVNLSLGYRNADGEFVLSDDDVYHYYGNVYAPLSNRVAVEFNGRLYSRDGHLPIQPDISGISVERDRFDRTANIGLLWHTDDHRAVHTLMYRHRRESANITKPYVIKLNQTAHGITLGREWQGGGSVLKAAISGDYLRFDDGRRIWERRWAGAVLSATSNFGAWRLAARSETQWVEDIKLVPSGAASVMYLDSNWMLLVSGGYVTRAPSQYERLLPFSQATLYPVGSGNYAEEGNRDVKKESQLTGSAQLRYTGRQAAIELSSNFGRIYDGIDWLLNLESIGGSSVRVFRPDNGDIDFFDISIRPELQVGEYVRFSSGAAYHWASYENIPRPTYAPQYQGWAGLELHYYWIQRGVHLLAYGEVVYSGPYDGYFTTGLGEDAILNGVLSLQLGSFEWHFTWRNVLTTVHQQREFSSFLGRLFTFGFVWNFLD